MKKLLLQKPRVEQNIVYIDNIDVRGKYFAFVTSSGYCGYFITDDEKDEVIRAVYCRGSTDNCFPWGQGKSIKHFMTEFSTCDFYLFDTQKELFEFLASKI